MSLIQAIVGVGLAALVVAGGIQYASPAAQLRPKIAAQAEGGFGALEGSYRARQAANLPAPATADWETALFPTYGERPAAVRGLGWSYGNTTDGVWFCLSGPLREDVVHAALTGLAVRYPPRLYDVTQDCGAKGGPPEQRIAATRWMRRAAP